jgi:hypothetical protein
VDEPAESVVHFLGGQDGRFLYALGVVCDGGYDAAFFGVAVTLVIDVAAVWWVVFSIDVVEPARRELLG